MYSEKLCFKNGKFKIMQIADVQDIFPVSEDSIKLITLATEKEKPDLVVFTGDQIYGLDPRVRIGGAEKNAEKIIKAYLAPLEKNNIPFCVTFGNHDNQCGVSNARQAVFYGNSPFFVKGNRRSDDDPGTTVISLYGTDSGNRVFDLVLFDSGGQKPTGEYLPVTSGQLEWYKDTVYGDFAPGKSYPHIVFQHIPVPEFYDVIKKVPRSEKNAVEAFRTHKNEFYVLPDEIKNAGGFMHESPAVPDENSGEFDTLKNSGACLAVIVGHDHINSFVADKDNIKLIYTQCAGFNVYGPKRKRGVRIIELSENDTNSFTTYTVTFDELCSDRLKHPVQEFVLTHIPTSMEQVKRIATVTGAAAAVLSGTAFAAIKIGAKRKSEKKFQ